MIKLLRSGFYKLIETKSHTKVLYIDEETYAWVEPVHIGEILVASRNIHKTDCVLSQGQYKLYDVDEEPKISDQMHLELEVGRGEWQGYLLLSGLPNDQKKRGRIIPTNEVITGAYKVENEAVPQQFSQRSAKSVGEKIGIDFGKIDLEEFRQGLMVELEHGTHDFATNVTNDDLETTGKIAWAHLKEMPDYYTHLSEMESSYERKAK